MDHDDNTPPKAQPTRRGLLLGGLFAAPALILPERSWASIGSGFCPPGSSSGGGGMGGGGGGGPLPVEDYTGAVPGEGPPDRSVYLINRSGDTLQGPYVQGGQYIPAALERFNWVARDWRHNEPTNMDPGLLDIVWALTEMLGTTAPYHINSGYRNPASNATVGGARQSLHMAGKALDLTNSQKSPSAMQGAARALRKGGVGSYRTFTHVDTGAVRTWNG